MENGDVRLIRWPAQDDIRERYLRSGIPCLLVVEAGAGAPLCLDAKEDWVRAPIARRDLEARLNSLRARAQIESKPQLDEGGTLHFRGASTPVSATQMDLMHLFVDRFETVVAREALRAELHGHHTPGGTRNSLDLHIMRLRRRIVPLSLGIRTVWGHGYVLERSLTTGTNS
jgi:DNA-binding response OmpR family regulator